ncbi:hypothetical protein CONLIGDRAFT_454281 [Coniochaeta ligniaria NRRL 30616]|uniref:Uncharacterized protein n=1 Tax=Coniochaeta ligniaria NRRL 30616 TaxID=1408157 RepID=A0A1J7IKV5_9PEZI|nr:hypothetical protein CONLIGDRAFT_454281 [Coniochaeta ligniaria NRRL 30616]
MATLTPTPTLTPTAVTLTVITVSGTHVQVAPLPTPFPSRSGCADNIWRRPEGTFVAWDPLYVSYVTSASTCFAPQVTSWWLFNSKTVSAYQGLGLTFACPEAYYTAATSVLSSESLQQVYCCPSQYGFSSYEQISHGVVPSQCTSVAPAGQVLSFLDVQIVDGSPAGNTTSSKLQSSATIYGVPVNGFNAISNQTSTLASSTAPPGTTDNADSSATAVASGPSGSKVGPPLGTVVGAAIGVVLALIAIAFAGFVFWRRRKRMMEDRTPSPGTFGLENMSDHDSVRPVVQKYELYTAEQKHELSATVDRHELYASWPATSIYELHGSAP